MHRQREKYNQISIVSLLLAFFIGLFAVIKSFYLFILFSLFLLFISLLSDAMLLHISFRKIDGVKQFARGFILFVLFIFLLFKLSKGS